MKAFAPIVLAFSLLLPGAVSVAQPMDGPMMGHGMMGHGMMGGGMMGNASPRRPYVMRYGPPAAAAEPPPARD